MKAGSIQMAWIAYSVTGVYTQFLTYIGQLF